MKKNVQINVTEVKVSDNAKLLAKLDEDYDLGLISENEYKLQRAELTSDANDEADTIVSNEKEYSFATMTKGMREVLLQTRTLSQALKVFNGLMGMTITANKIEMTIGQWFEACGVAVGKNGRISPKQLLAAWKIKDEQGMPQVYRNVPVRLMSEDKGDKSTATRIYIYDSEDSEYEPASVYKRVVIEENRWTADVILRGLLQGAFMDKMEKKAEKSADDWKAVKKVYRFSKQTQKGSVTNKAIECKKENCVF